MILFCNAFINPHKIISIERSETSVKDKNGKSYFITVYLQDDYSYRKEYSTEAERDGDLIDLVYSINDLPGFKYE